MYRNLLGLRQVVMVIRPGQGAADALFPEQKIVGSGGVTDTRRCVANKGLVHMHAKIFQREVS